MIKLCKRDILIQKESIPTAKAIKKFERYGMKDKFIFLNTEDHQQLIFTELKVSKIISMDIWRIQQEFLNILT